MRYNIKRILIAVVMICILNNPLFAFANENADNHNESIELNFSELAEGEIVSKDIDGDGIDDIFIECTDISYSLTRGSTQYVYATFNINVNILGVSYTAATANMTCRYYSDGLNGYVESLYGTATPKGVFSCSFDSYQDIMPGFHTLFLNIYGLGKSWTVAITGHYNALDGTASIGIS